MRGASSGRFRFKVEGGRIERAEHGSPEHVAGVVLTEPRSWTRIVAMALLARRRRILLPQAGRRITSLTTKSSSAAPSKAEVAGSGRTHFWWTPQHAVESSLPCEGRGGQGEQPRFRHALVAMWPVVVPWGTAASSGALPLVSAVAPGAPGLAPHRGGRASTGRRPT